MHLEGVDTGDRFAKLAASWERASEDAIYAFNDLHAMFMTQYTELWNAVDLIAERIRSLGHFAPGTYKAFSDLSSIKEEDAVPNANTMLENLLTGHETVARTCRDTFPAAEKAGDQPTMDLLTQRLQVHEKTAWMLRSILGR